MSGALAPRLWSGIPEYLIAGVTYERTAIRNVLPPMLEPADTSSGGMIVFEADRNIGFPMFKAAQIWIDVKGHDTPDGIPGRYVVGGFYSKPNVTQALQEAASVKASVGWAKLRTAGGHSVGEAGSSNGSNLRLTARSANRMGRFAAYYHYYLGVNDKGVVETLPMGVSNLFEEVTPEFADLSFSAGDAPELHPTGFLWAARPRNGVFSIETTIRGPTHWEERSRESAAIERLSSLLRLIQCGAILVDGSGDVVTLNDAALRMLGDGLEIFHSRLLTTKGAQQELEQLLASSLSPTMGDESQIVAIHRSRRRTPLLVQAVPIGPMNHFSFDLSPGRAVFALLLITDVEEPHPISEAHARLLGLTPAEARVAAAVGSGLSPRQASASLDVSEGTVRSALSIIYGKLGISRQSELALVMARLSATRINQADRGLGSMSPII